MPWSFGQAGRAGKNPRRIMARNRRPSRSGFSAAFASVFPPMVLERKSGRFNFGWPHLVENESQHTTPRRPARADAALDQVGRDASPFDNGDQPVRCIQPEVLPSRGGCEIQNDKIVGLACLADEAWNFGRAMAVPGSERNEIDL